MPPIVQVNDLRKRYGDIEAVRGISFFVEPGEVFGLLGPNGAGKTTTVEILEGLRRADGGSATVAGVDVLADPSGVKRRIGVQLQASAFPEHLTAKETVEFFAACYDLTVDAIALLRSVDLDRAREHPGGPVPRRTDHGPRSAGPAQAVGPHLGDPRSGHDGLPDDALPRRGRGPLRPRRDHGRRAHRRPRPAAEAHRRPAVPRVQQADGS